MINVLPRELYAQASGNAQSTSSLIKVELPIGFLKVKPLAEREREVKAKPPQCPEKSYQSGYPTYACPSTFLPS